MKTNSSFTINYEIGYDSDEKANCLDIIDNITNRVTRMYYKSVDEIYIRNMPESTLHELHKRIKSEILRRVDE